MAKKQVNIDLTENRHERLMYLARKTKSVSTSPRNRGAISIGAMLRRICEGEIEIYYNGEKIEIPFHFWK